MLAEKRMESWDPYGEYGTRAVDRVEAFAHAATPHLDGCERRRLHDRLVCQDLADVLAAQGGALLRRVDVDALNGQCRARLSDGTTVSLHAASLDAALVAEAGEAGAWPWPAPVLLDAVASCLARLDAQAAAVQQADTSSAQGGQPEAAAVAVLFAEGGPPGALRALPVVELLGFGPYAHLRAAYVLAPNPQRPLGLQALRVGIDAGRPDWGGRTVLGRRRG